MTRTGRQQIIIVLLLLVFISQSVAAAIMSCQHNGNTREAISNMHQAMADMNDMAGMEHEGHAPGMDHPAPQPQQTDCCKSFGHCSAGGCSLALGSETVILFTRLSASISDLYSSTLPIALATSLFRPPIFR